jgi:hypothetical protein
MNNVAEVLKKLTAKQFDALIGTPEGAWLDGRGVEDETNRVQLAFPARAIKKVMEGWPTIWTLCGRPERMVRPVPAIRNCDVIVRSGNRNLRWSGQTTQELS